MAVQSATSASISSAPSTRHSPPELVGVEHEPRLRRSRGSAHARALPKDGLLLEHAAIAPDDLLHGLARLRGVGMNQQQHLRSFMVDGAPRRAPLTVGLPNGK